MYVRTYVCVCGCIHVYSCGLTIGTYTRICMSVAATDLFPFANQCPRQAIWPYTDQSPGRAHWFLLSLSRTIFLVLLVVSRQPQSHDRPLTPSQKNTQLLASHTEEPALRSVTRTTHYSDTQHGQREPRSQPWQTSLAFTEEYAATSFTHRRTSLAVSHTSNSLQWHTTWSEST